MSAFGLILICAQAIILQGAYSQCLGAGFGYGLEPFAPGYGYGLEPYGYGYGAGIGLPGPNYGGAGVGEVAVAGELPVGGVTLVAGQVPVLGAVEFGGVLPAAGTVTISGSCACGCGGYPGPYIY